MADIRILLTDKSIAQLPAPKDGWYSARDTELKGFFVVVGKQKRTFTVLLSASIALLSTGAFAQNTVVTTTLCRLWPAFFLQRLLTAGLGAVGLFGPRSGTSSRVLPGKLSGEGGSPGS